MNDKKTNILACQAGALRASRVPLIVFLLFFAILLTQLQLSSADPSGASITFNSSQTAAASAAHTRNDSGGTINTILLSATQQDSAWKAYVGNVTGALTLDDATGNTIYNWQLLSIAGEVYASRSTSVTWGAINCSNQSHVDAEQTAVAFTSADSDSINRTFNSTNHMSFLVASRNMSNCRSTATYVNDTFQPQINGALFPEILLSDGTNFVYSSIISTSSPWGFDDERRHFQMIVPQSKATGTPTTYYFYLELS